MSMLGVISSVARVGIAAECKRALLCGSKKISFGFGDFTETLGRQRF
jgi:hypothetical protein